MRNNTELMGLRLRTTPRAQLKAATESIQNSTTCMSCMANIRAKVVRQKTKAPDFFLLLLSFASCLLLFRDQQVFFLINKALPVVVGRGHCFGQVHRVLR